MYKKKCHAVEQWLLIDINIIGWYIREGDSIETVYCKILLAIFMSQISEFRIGWRRYYTRRSNLYFSEECRLV